MTRAEDGVKMLTPEAAPTLLPSTTTTEEPASKKPSAGCLTSTNVNTKQPVIKPNTKSEDFLVEISNPAPVSKHPRSLLAKPSTLTPCFVG